MNSVLVKICGITTLADAKEAIKAGSDFLGFNFVPESSRYIHETEAKKIIDRIRGEVNTVGIFQHATIEKITHIADFLNLDYVQVQDLSYEDAGKIRSKKIITIPVPNNPDLKSIIDTYITYEADFYLLDRPIRGKGELINFPVAKALASKLPVLLAGGLTPENVSGAVDFVCPIGVDTAGGVETQHNKDIDKIRRFITNAKGLRI